MDADDLHTLVRAHDIQGVSAWLSQQVDPHFSVNQTDQAGNPALLYAVNREKVSLEMVELLLKAGADPNQGEIDLAFFGGDTVYKVAINAGDPSTVRLLHSYGANPTSVGEDGYSIVVTAVHGHGNRLPLVQAVIEMGFPVNPPSNGNPEAVTGAYRLARFDVLTELIAAGADTSVLQWPPLTRAVAIGTKEDIERELAKNPDLEATDLLGQTAFHVALMKGELATAKLLRVHGASPTALIRERSTSMSCAARGGSVEVMQWLTEEFGFSIDEQDFLGQTPLYQAVEDGDIQLARALLELGADPNAGGRYGTILGAATDKDIISLILTHGADPKDIQARVMLGLGEVDDLDLREVSEEEYSRAKSPREGRSNPEEANEPFWLAMIKTGVNAYAARSHFNDLDTFGERVNGQRLPAVWCAQRFGQSFTLLPDGRMILIAGEHEDGYDPDFCIYNDVFIAEPDGNIRVLIYPHSAFPPTDFHTATLADDYIYIIGSLGYVGSREGDIPVYRLSLEDFHIEPVSTQGRVPRRIFGHRALLLNEATIRIQGGTAILFNDGVESHVPNTGTFDLDLETMTWSQP